MRLPVVGAAACMVAAAVLLAPAVTSVGETLAANTWRLPIPDLDVLKGPELAPLDEDDDDANLGDTPPPPPVLIPTTTTITESPSRIEKGETFEVEGLVVDQDGEAVAGAIVILFLNETKEEPGFRVGRTTTDALGIFRFETDVPRILPARQYQIVAQSLDSLQGRVLFLESWSDPPADVHSDTVMRMHAPDQAAIGDLVLVQGKLLDVTGGAVREAVVQLRVDDEIVNTTLTDGQGWYAMTYVFEEAGEYEISVRYDGNAYYTASTARDDIKITGTSHEVKSDTSVLRNSTLEMSGIVQLENNSDPTGIEVVVRFHNLTFNGTDTLTFVTDDAGQWSTELFVPGDTPLGHYTVEYDVPSLGLHEERTLAVQAQTTVVLDAPTRLGVEGVLHANATLLDDRGNPVPEQQVRLDAGGRSLKGWTDENGTVRFRTELPGGTHGVRASYGGDGLLRGSDAAVDVQVEMTFVEAARPWAAYVLAGLAALALAAYLASRHGRRQLRKAAAALDPRQPVRLAIELPEIDTDLPDVWGVGEPLVVEARAATNDGQPLPSLPVRVEAGAPQSATTDASGRFRTEVSFAVEGVAALTAAFAGDARRRPASLERPVRIVEYRRVIEEGFEELRALLGSHGIPVHEATPPRELERRIRETAPTLAQEDLDRLLTLFEVSDYSERPIGRDEWVVFHRTRVALERALAERVGAVARPPRQEGAHAA